MKHQRRDGSGAGSGFGFAYGKGNGFGAGEGSGDSSGKGSGKGIYRGGYMYPTSTQSACSDIYFGSCAYEGHSIKGEWRKGECSESGYGAR